jgi:hypothetical protein
LDDVQDLQNIKTSKQEGVFMVQVLANEAQSKDMCCARLLKGVLHVSRLIDTYVLRASCDLFFNLSTLAEQGDAVSAKSVNTARESDVAKIHNERGEGNSSH